MPNSSSSRRWAFSLPVVLTVPFVLLLLAAVGLVGYLALRSSQQATEDIANQLISEVGERVTENLENYVATPHQVNATKLDAYQLNYLQFEDLTRWEKFLLEQVEHYPYINFTSIANTQGDYRTGEKLSNGQKRINVSGKNTQFTFYSYETNAKGDRTTIALKVPNFDVRQHSAYQEAVKAKKPAWSSPYVSFLEPTLILSAIQPVYEPRSQQLKGVLFSALRLDFVGKFLNELKIGKTGQAFILERNGSLIATSTKELPFRDEKGQRNLIQANTSQNPLTQSTVNALQQQSQNLRSIQTGQLFRLDVQNQPHYIKVLPFQDQHGLDWLIVVVVPESDFTAQIDQQRTTSVVLCLAAAGLTLLLSWLTSRWLTHPILQLNQAAKNLAQGQWDTPLQGRDRRDEVGELARSFASMTQQLQSSFSQLAEANQTLEQRVDVRTRELLQTVEDLQTTQQELIQAEKMAALGQLIAGVAHEINTPLGAIRGASSNSNQALQESFQQLPTLWQILPTEQQANFFTLVQAALQGDTLITSREKRQRVRSLTATLEQAGISTARHTADTLVDMGIHESVEAFLPLLRHPKQAIILQTAYNLARLQGNQQTIRTAVDRVSKIVFALRSYARYDHSGNPVMTQISEGLETVLTLYHNQLKHGIDVHRHYETLPPILCFPDELNQVWTNLIHNAAQAMQGKGDLTIQIQGRSRDDLAYQVVEIIDSGCGISQDIMPRIFEPFFTTKPMGEGSGLGLDIVKKIIEKHHGLIEVESQVGKTQFRIWIPSDYATHE
ncbi:MAG: ATP-binding protein [Synechococcales bacterium]|nr:ATP-binding protein [Synechococcales bacterium]